MKLKFSQAKNGSTIEDRMDMWRGRWDKSMTGWHKNTVNEHFAKYYDYLLVINFHLLLFYKHYLSYCVDSCGKS